MGCRYVDLEFSNGYIAVGNEDSFKASVGLVLFSFDRNYVLFWILPEVLVIFLSLVATGNIH